SVVAASTQNTPVATPSDGAPTVATTKTVSTAMPTIPPMANVRSTIRGMVGSTRYQCPRSISPVIPPRARVAVIARSGPPYCIADMAKTTDASPRAAPDTVRLRFTATPPTAAASRATATTQSPPRTGQNPMRMEEAATSHVKPGPTMFQMVTTAPASATPPAQARRTNIGSDTETGSGLTAGAVIDETAAGEHHTGGRRDHRQGSRSSPRPATPPPRSPPQSLRHSLKSP